jgi:hypothetical protein
MVAGAVESRVSAAGVGLPVGGAVASGVGLVTLLDKSYLASR